MNVFQIAILLIVSIVIGVILSMVILGIMGKRRRMAISLKRKRKALSEWLKIYKNDLSDKYRFKIDGAIMLIDQTLEVLKK